MICFKEYAILKKCRVYFFMFGSNPGAVFFKLKIIKLRKINFERKRVYSRLMQ